MDDIKQNIAEQIAKVLEQDVQTVIVNIEKPKMSDLGDFAYPCFRLAATFKKAPPLIAQEIKDKLGDIAGVSKIEVVAGYINFFADNAHVTDVVIKDILEEKDDCYKLDEGIGKTVCIDYSSPNIAKPFHIGHLRSTVIGAALVKIYKMLGYNVVGINHLGDFGTQFGYVIEGYKRFGKDYDLSTEPIKKLVEICNWQNYTISAAGDYDNDLAMLEYANIGFAPANAQEIVKKSASYVTKATCEDGAIAEAIEYIEKVCKVK